MNADASRSVNELLRLDPATEPIIREDIDGPDATAQRIDRRLSIQSPELAVKPAARLATFILSCSFDQARAQKGCTESQIMESCLDANLARTTAVASLSELREFCLFLEFDGDRYWFSKKPNIIGQMEFAARAVDNRRVVEQIRGLLETELVREQGAVLWPDASGEVPDEPGCLWVAYLSLDFLRAPPGEQEQRVTDILERHGNAPRSYCNSIAVAVPSQSDADDLAGTRRRLIAVDEMIKEYSNLEEPHLGRLMLRKAFEEARAEAHLRHLYQTIWVRNESGKEQVKNGVKAQGEPGVHNRVLAILRNCDPPKLLGSLAPDELIRYLGLGQQVFGMNTCDAVNKFYQMIGMPRLLSYEVLQKAIAKAVVDQKLAYAQSSLPALGPDQKYQVSPNQTIFAKLVHSDEIDLTIGCIILPQALPDVIRAPH